MVKKKQPRWIKKKKGGRFLTQLFKCFTREMSFEKKYTLQKKLALPIEEKLEGKKKQHGLKMRT